MYFHGVADKHVTVSTFPKGSSSGPGEGGAGVRGQGNASSWRDRLSRPEGCRGDVFLWANQEAPSTNSHRYVSIGFGIK